MGNWKDAPLIEEPVESSSWKDAPLVEAEEPKPIAQRNAAPERISTVTGMTPAQAQSRAEAGSERFAEVAAPVVRYGLPIAAGIAAMPVTGGMSAPAAMATMSGIGSGSSAISEFAAQQIEGREDPNAVGAAAMYGATPFKTTGGFLSRSALNIPSSLVSNEVAKFIEAGGSDEYKKGLSEDVKIVRWGVPAGLSAIASMSGARAGRIETAANARANIAKERFGGSVLLSEVFPEFASKEADAIARGNATARAAFDGMGENIGEAIMKLVPEGAAQIPEVANRLRQHVGRLTELQNQYRVATSEATKAAVLAEDAQRANSTFAADLKKKSELAAMEAVQKKQLYNTAVDVMFGGRPNNIESLTTGKLIEDLKETATAAKGAASAGVTQLYEKAGISPNDPVVSMETINRAIKKYSQKGYLLEDNDLRNEFVAMVNGAMEGTDNPTLAALDKVLTGKPSDPVIPLGRFRRLKDSFAEELVRKGKDPVAANRIAAERYAILREASDDYMKTMRPDVYEAWQGANKAAFENFSGMKTDAIDMISKGDMPGLLTSIREKGFNGALSKELMDYKEVIAKTYDATKPGAKEAAEMASEKFMSDISLGLKGALINSRIDRANGITEGFRNVDIEKLAGDLQKMASGGFPVEVLGMGTPAQVRAMSKIAGAGKPGGLSVDEMNDFFALLPQLGADKAAARLDYKRAARDYLIANKFVEKQKATNKLLDAQKRAGIDASIVEKEMIEAGSDPLVRLLNGTDVALGSDPKQNAGWVNRLLKMDSGLAGDFIETLKASGRTEDAEKLSKAAAATVLRQFEGFSENGASLADMKKISEFFYGQGTGQDAARNTLKVIMGRDSYDSIVKQIVNPIQRIVSTQRSMYVPIEQTALRNARVKVMPANVGLFAMVGLDKIVNMAKDARYNQLYTLYINPKSASRFAKYQYDIDKAISADPVARNMLRLASAEDEKAKAESQRWARRVAAKRLLATP